jgi:transcriptional regulator of nitric oxide reductase
MQMRIPFLDGNAVQVGWNQLLGRALSRLVLGCALWSFAAAFALAGVMNREELAKRFPAPYIVGEKDSVMPVWPIFVPNFQQKANANQLVGYVFESIDLAPVPGFSGVPINLLVAIDQRGNFIDVAVLSQHEPVFVGGLGEVPLHAFVGQYKGLSLKQSIKILTGTHGAKNSSAEAVELDGVTKATASLRIINQSILSSALKVARKKLGFAEGRDPELIARIKPGVLELHSIKELIDARLVTHAVLSNADIEQKFAASNGSGLDPEAIAHPEDTFIDLYLACVSVPSIGRNLLNDASWTRLQNRLEPDDHAILVMSKGRYTVTGNEFVRGSAPDRIVLRQDQLPIEMRDLNLEIALKEDPGLGLDRETFTIFRVIGRAGLDPSRPLDFVLPVTRLKGLIYPERIVRDVTVRLQLPERFFTVPEGDMKSWRSIWRDRWVEVVVLVIGLGILTAALVLQSRLVADARRFALFRNGFLLFTLFFVGWYAQGQLSIVNITSVLQALMAGRSLSFYLYDPMTVTLSIFTAVSLVFWGRGTFCGWLCPFGALQEFVAKLGQALQIRPMRLNRAVDRRLKLFKYLVLAGVLASAAISSGVTDRAVEVEPFKTAITLNFVRTWPFVVYAVGLLLANLFVYKFFCRALCPLGAGLALLGRMRLLDWIPRRSECGSPCQTCRNRCEYQAITPTGKIQYDECFQCMDCVVIYASDKKCAPLMMAKKRARVVPIHAATTR